MIDDILARIFFNQWLVFVIVTLLLLLLGEFGYRFGLASRKRNEKAAESHSGSVQGAVLGLLGLLLGFTFAMSVGRYDNRRSLTIDEANSIGTTWLRSDFLPAPHATEVKSLLRDYTRLKVDSTALADHTPAMDDYRKKVSAAQQELWNHATAATVLQPSPVTVSFVTTLNETIDLDSSRLAASRNHVPGAVWLLLLLVVSGCGAWASGYGSGSGGLRSSFNQVVFPVLIGVVITLISDIDRPRKGLIGVSQEPMQALLESMQPPSGN